MTPKYKWVRKNHSACRIDGVVIYNLLGSLDWEEFEAWVIAGGVPGPEDTKLPAVDRADLDRIPKELKAAVLAAAILSGKTPAQAKAAFRAAWKSLS